MKRHYTSGKGSTVLKRLKGQGPLLKRLNYPTSSESEVSVHGFLFAGMDSAPVETDSPKGSCRFVKESQSLPLDAFASYYGHRLPQCALIDEVSSEEGTTRGGDYASESSDTLSTGEYVLNT